jgi:hypothetical protein
MNQHSSYLLETDRTGRSHGQCGRAPGRSVLSTARHQRLGLTLVFGSWLANASAHPGHGFADYGIAHWLTNADHAAIPAAIAGGLLLGGLALRRGRWRRAVLGLGWLTLMGVLFLRPILG